MSPSAIEIRNIMLAADDTEAAELIALLAVEAIEQRDSYSEAYHAAVDLLRAATLDRDREREQRQRLLDELRAHRARQRERV